MDPSRPTDRSHRAFAITTLRTVLLTPIPFAEIRLIDMVAIWVGAAIAIVVCLPIVAGTLLAGAAIGLALKTIGAPEAATALPGVIGFVSGLAVSFVILLRIYRRFPARVRAWVIPSDDDPVPSPTAHRFGHDPDHETLLERVVDAAKAIAPDDIDLDLP